jgi:hypothetical protein
VFSEAIAVGISAFLEGDEPPTDEAVTASLESAGVERWLAERLLVFLPMAFGRQLLDGVTLAGTFVDGPSERALTDEPVYVAAVARAGMASSAELERIGLRSAEVSAVNSALNAGSRLDDLVLTATALTSPLPPPEPGDGGVTSPRAAFEAFLAGHGFAVQDGRVGEMQVDARVFPHPRRHPGYVTAQVDFAVRHPALAREWLLESFASAGATWRDALAASVTKFERASLHPLIAALLDRTAGRDQVSWETYEHPGGVFDLCLGAQLTLYAPEAAPPSGPLFDRLLLALRDVPLNRAVHWLRTFTCHDDGDLTTNEVLLDGQPWAGGEAVVAAAAPPVPSGMVCVRLFGLLVPA